MINNPYEMAQPVYQADPSIIPMLHNVKDHAFHHCREHVNRYVRIQTIHGQTFEGTIVNVETPFVYLMVASVQNYDRAFLNPYDNVILPLVLYELLVITLLA